LMADIICDAVPRPPPGWLVPIPAGRRRLRQRGYNQAEMIARPLGARWRMPVATAILRRVRETKTQTALTPEGRLANVAGAFVAAPVPASMRAPGSRVRQAILVDDVLTTGATLDAAAVALATAGWPAVGVVTFARAMPFETRALVGQSRPVGR
jgi:predicted amidophosphoribosyltransferase